MRAKTMKLELALYEFLTKSENKRLARHQYALRRLWMDKPGMMLYHGQGTGKTRCSLNMAIPYLKANYKIIILTKDKIVPYWQKEIKEMTSEDIKIYGYTYFCNSKKILELDKYVLIVDEAHKIVGKTKIHQHIKHLIEKNNRKMKLLLLSGTPNFNNPYSIADLLNLILLLSNEPLLLTEEKFLENVFTNEHYNWNNYEHNKVDNFLKECDSIKKSVLLCDRSHYQYFNRVVHKYVSFLEKWKLNIDVNYKVEKCYMDKEGKQLEILREKMAEIKNTELTSIQNFIDLRCMDNCVLPNGAYGKQIEEEVMFNENYNILKFANKDYYKEFNYEHLHGKSSKFKIMLDYISLLYVNTDCNIIGKHKGKVHVFMDRIKGNIDILGLTFLSNGFSYYPDQSGSKGCFAIITGNTSKDDCKLILREYNSEANKNGDKIKILISTEVLREGVTLNNVKLGFVSQWWNRNSIDQTVTRYIRQCANNECGEITVIELLNAFPEEFSTIDEILYSFSHLKKIISEKIKHFIYFNSIDYDINKKYNVENGLPVGRIEEKGKGNNFNIYDENVCYDVFKNVASIMKYALLLPFDKLCETLFEKYLLKPKVDLKIANIQHSYENIDNQKLFNGFVHFVKYVITDKCKNKLIFDFNNNKSRISIRNNFVMVMPIHNNLFNYAVNKTPLNLYDKYWEKEEEEEKEIEKEKINEKEKDKGNEKVKEYEIFNIKDLGKGYSAYIQKEYFNGEEKEYFLLVLPFRNIKYRKNNQVNLNSINHGRKVEHFRIKDLREITEKLNICIEQKNRKSNYINELRKFYDKI